MINILAYLHLTLFDGKTHTSFRLFDHPCRNIGNPIRFLLLVNAKLSYLGNKERDAFLMLLHDVTTDFQLPGQPGYLSFAVSKTVTESECFGDPLVIRTL